MQTIHNPDRYMFDLRQALSQGRKRIGLLIGAGAPTSIRINVNPDTESNGDPLIPDVAGLTKIVLKLLSPDDQTALETISKDFEDTPNIEDLLTRTRRLSQAIGKATFNGLTGEGYRDLSDRICNQIGSIVGAALPPSPNPYSELISWIAGTNREHAVEIFTPNYDLLTEEAFERAKLPYFDGFTGSREPFFDAASISMDSLPARWSRLWKLHGSLGWDVVGNAVIRNGQRTATKMIYPDHLKYDEITRLPYSALFERLREFLTTPDSLLICSGFSFGDAHICALLDEALAANAHTAILAFQFKPLADESKARRLAANRPNLSIYARDGAVINGVEGKWQPGEPLNDEWQEIRKTFWRNKSLHESEEFLLGDFAKLARFFALAQSQSLSIGGPTETPPFAKQGSPDTSSSAEGEAPKE